MHNYLATSHTKAQETVVASCSSRNLTYGRSTITREVGNAPQLLEMVHASLPSPMGFEFYKKKIALELL